MKVTTMPTVVDCVIPVHENLHLSLSFWHDIVTFVFFSIPSVTLGRLHMSRQLLKHFTSSEANVLFCLQMCVLKRRNSWKALIWKNPHGWIGFMYTYIERKILLCIYCTFVQKTLLLNLNLVICPFYVRKQFRRMYFWFPCWIKFMLP